MDLMKEVNEPGPLRSLTVKADGTVYIGPSMSKVKMLGLLLDEAEQAIKKQIEKVKYDPVSSNPIQILNDEGMPKKDLDLKSYRISPGDLLGISMKASDGFVVIGLEGQSRVQYDGNVAIELSGFRNVHNSTTATNTSECKRTNY